MGTGGCAHTRKRSCLFNVRFLDTLISALFGGDYVYFRFLNQALDYLKGDGDCLQLVLHTRRRVEADEGTEARRGRLRLNSCATQVAIAYCRAVIVVGPGRCLATSADFSLARHSDSTSLPYVLPAVLSVPGTIG
jgi:hypothetical protein